MAISEIYKCDYGISLYLSEKELIVSKVDSFVAHLDRCTCVGN